MKDALHQQTNLEDTFRNFSSIVIIIKDNYNFNYVNHIATNILGYKEKEILHMSFIELLTPDSLELCIDNIRSLRESSFCQPFIVHILKKNGGILSLELAGIKLKDGRFFFTGRNLSLERIRKEKLEYLEALNKHILNSIEEGIVVLDPQGNIERYNDFMEKNFHWSKKIIGKNAFRLFPTMKKYGLLESFVNIIDKGVSEKRDHVTGTTNDGKQVVLNIRGYPLKRNKGMRGVVVVVEDITHSDEISKQIKKATDMREKVHRIIESIIPLNTISEILNKVSAGLQQELLYERGAIFLSQEQRHGSSLLKLFSSINTEKDMEQARSKIEKNMKTGKGLIKDIFKTGKSRIVKNINRERSFLRIFRDTKSEMIVPIRIRTEPAGIIAIDSRQPDFFDETDLRFTEMLANSLAITIEKTRFFEELLTKAHYLSTLYETSQILRHIEEEKGKFTNILKQISQNLDSCISLVMRINGNNNTKIVAYWKAPAEIRKVFANVSNNAKEKFISEIRTGNPLIADSIQKKHTGLMRKLYNHKIKGLYIFPLMSKLTLSGCLIILGLKPSALYKEQISFLTAIAHQMSAFGLNQT